MHLTVASSRSSTLASLLNSLMDAFCSSRPSFFASRCQAVETFTPLYLSECSSTCSKICPCVVHATMSRFSRTCSKNNASSSSFSTSPLLFPLLLVVVVVVVASLLRAVQKGFASSNTTDFDETYQPPFPMTLGKRGEEEDHHPTPKCLGNAPVAFVVVVKVVVVVVRRRAAARRRSPRRSLPVVVKVAMAVLRSIPHRF